MHLSVSPDDFQQVNFCNEIYVALSDQITVTIKQRDLIWQLPCIQLVILSIEQTLHKFLCYFKFEK